jgi:hypothetical protein
MTHPAAARPIYAFRSRKANAGQAAAARLASAANPGGTGPEGSTG